MIRHLVLLLARLTRSLMRGVRRIVKGVSGLLVVALIALNVTMIAVPAVYNFLSNIMWSTVSLLSEGFAARNATAAKPRAVIDADASRRLELEVERDRLRAERAEVEARLGRTESALAEVRGREERAAQELLESRRQNTVLADRVRTAELELGSASERSRQSRQLAGETLTRMEQRSLRMVSRNTATVFTDALPLIGAVTIVGGIAWDVWDTCAQLDDLRALGHTLELPDRAEDELEQRWCGLSRDEVFTLLFRVPPTKEALCVQARLRTGSIEPPECVEFAVDPWTFPDPLNQSPATPPALPTMNYD